MNLTWNSKGVQFILKCLHPAKEGGFSGVERLTGPLNTHCYEQSYEDMPEKEAIVLHLSGIFTKAFHRHFIQTSGNCVMLWEKGSDSFQNDSC